MFKQKTQESKETENKETFPESITRDYLVLQNLGEGCAPPSEKSRRDRNRRGADADAVFSDFSLRMSWRASEIQFVGFAKFMSKASVVRGISDLPLRSVVLRVLQHSILLWFRRVSWSVQLLYNSSNSWDSILNPETKQKNSETELWVVHRT